MAAILLMLLATAGIVIFFIKTGKAGKSSAAEIVLSRAWLNRFARQELEEKKLDYLRAYDKYHVDPEKKARKKVREWDKQTRRTSSSGFGRACIKVCTPLVLGLSG